MNEQAIIASFPSVMCGSDIQLTQFKLSISPELRGLWDARKAAVNHAGKATETYIPQNHYYYYY
jgi:hypothetical protein